MTNRAADRVRGGHRRLLTLAAGVTDQFGYFATGGPSRVGVAVGNAVRTMLIVVVSVSLLVSPAISGSNGNLNISG